MPALILAHLIFVLPYVFLSLDDPWRAFDRRYEAIAAGLGKGRWTTLFAIRLPMLARAVLTGAAVGFAVSIGQYLPTVLVGAGRIGTITTEAVALASGGNRRVIGVYAILQMLLPAAGFLVATLIPSLIFRSRRAMRV
jgi:putative thiamine transport system permease protein